MQAHDLSNSKDQNAQAYKRLSLQIPPKESWYSLLDKECPI